MDILKLSLISVFKNILNDEVISSYIKFITAMYSDTSINKTLKLYSEFINRLYNTEKTNPDLYEHLENLIYTDKNVMSVDNSGISTLIYNSAKYELTVFDELLSYNYEFIKKLLSDKYPDHIEIINELPAFTINFKEKFSLEDIITSYRTQGYGIYMKYRAFKFLETKEIVPVKHYNAMTFKELKNYRYQQEVILSNTKALINGKEANNILLYGDRGCGKSSTVKALINEFSDSNLKIIQISKESFIYLSDLYEQLRNIPLKFIIFADDISFDENDNSFSTVKAVLEGSVSEKPSNTVIYATTNRMHLVKESFTSREGNELHINDTIDETASLSDRFGIMLTFSSLTKNEYLDIVRQIAQDFSVTVDEKLYREAEMFAMLKAIRTPRVAHQFIIDYLGRI